ncbi:MAG: hypothetical protein EOP45_04685 [Sphingobacteriaceae bacterium]|nr:MAG: hypothetical protein EOP45_04685 [Sphingobacteriaceae bacterium]
MRFYLYSLVFIFSSVSAFAQQSAPHVSGKVIIAMDQGLIKCDFKLSKLPALGKQYKLLLNRGFNIGLLRNDSGRVLSYNGFYGSKLNGEAVAYIPVDHDDVFGLPGNLNISYVGAFPVYRDTLNAFDFKGFIAFNGKTLRAAEQSKWYPVIYDIKNDKELLDVTYDITVECKDCKTLYLNGSQAQAGPVATFKSEKPRQLLLFAGDYNKQTLSSTFLNAGLTGEEAKVFDDNINSITIFYKDYLRIPYGEKITFLQHQPVEPFGPKRSWGFVTFPTIAIAGPGFKKDVDLQTGLFRDTSTYRFYAHELGHFYYGQVLQPGSTLRWFFLESMAEFLSVKAAESKYGKVATQRYIEKRKPGVEKLQIIPLSEIAEADKIGDAYRYNYAPFILLAMEKRFGVDKVRSFCQQVLKNSGQQTDYAFFVKAVKASGIKDADWKQFEHNVIAQRECKTIFNFL